MVALGGAINVAVHDDKRFLHTWNPRSKMVALGGAINVAVHDDKGQIRHDLLSNDFQRNLNSLRSDMVADLQGKQQI
ncbi:hypothetical protein HanPI659440_Chr16g0654461 [Helianthus annuus]|nr:hypothetical protein HanPI659440_Chr16g0654461 [Helianthus annuus]